MSEENPFRRLKLAAERQKLPPAKSDGIQILTEPSHPATALIAESIRNRPKTREAEPPVTVSTVPEPSAIEPIPPTEVVDVVVEPPQDFTAAPWWAAKREQPQQGLFYAPVVIHVPPRDSAARGTEQFADFESLKTPTPGKFFTSQRMDRLLANLSRPRALGWGVGLVFACLLITNVFSGVKSNAADRAENVAKENQLRNTLALLDQTTPVVPQRAAAVQHPVGLGAANAAEVALPAATINEYVTKALPQLIGPQPHTPTESSEPLSVQQRPLPAVPVIASVSGGSSAAIALSSSKPAVSDEIDGDAKHIIDTRSTQSKKRSAIRSGSKALTHSISTREADVDPLAGLLIKSEVIPSKSPFIIRDIRRKDGEWQANILSDVANSTESATWATAGHTFANGWQVIDVEKNRVAFLSPDGQVVASTEYDNRNR